MFHFLTTIKNDVEDAGKATAHAAGNVAHAGKNTLNFITSSPKDNSSKIAPVLKGIGDSLVVNPAHASYDLGRGAVAALTGNKKAETNANKAKATDYPKVLNAPARATVQTARTIEGLFGKDAPDYQAKTPEEKTIFGSKPIQSVQSGVKTNLAEHHNPFVAALYGGGQIAQDAATLAGGKVGAESLAEAGAKTATTATKGAKAAVKAVDEHATNIASKHPAVVALDQHIDQLNQHRAALVKDGASEIAIQANDSALKSAMKSRSDSIKAIKEGGFIGGGDAVPGVTPAKQSFINALAPPTEVPTKPGFTPEEPKNTAQVANESLPKGAQLPSNVVDLLGKTGKATDAASKAPVLEGARDPHSVAARYFGKEGSDIVYDATKGAKTRSDLQNAANPLIDTAEKALNKAAKTSVGKADVESRINQALEDRTNADTYLKTPQEKTAYDAAKAFYDHYQAHLTKAGKGTLENYSPRIARKNAEEASSGLDRSVTQAFSKNTDASFLKERTKPEADQALLEKPISAMRGYSSAVSKQLAYEDMMKKLPDRLNSVKPIYTADDATKQKGTAYMQKYLKDLLQPDIPTSGKGLGKLISERTQNKLINQTYKSALQLSPKFGLMNRTQGYVTHSQVSKSARNLVKKMDKNDLADLRGDLTTGDAGVTAEATQSASNVGTAKGKLDKLQSKISGEQTNVNHAFNAGAAQHIVDSAPYKAAIKAGMKPKEAAKEALKDPATKDLATRAGNVVVNTTQFGGNIANKPEWLRETGTVLGLSKKWFQQYQRFPMGMLQVVGNVTNPNNARALDIMRRGDPKQTKLVDYLKAAKTLQNALPDAHKAIKAGESAVTPEQLKSSKDLLDKSVKVLQTEIKKSSQIRAGKTGRKLVKMWAAASAIQFLFSEATSANKNKTTGQKVVQSLKYGAPVNIPTKNQNPLTPSPASSPFTAHGISGRKLLNFIPVVGPVVARGKEAAGFINALTGGSQ